MGLLAALAAALGLCAAIVIVVDPFFHYRTPDPEAEVWFEERGQAAGLLRSQDYETVLMGTSLAANYRPLWFDAYFNTKTVKVTFPNGGFHEFTQALDYACETHPVKRVIFGLDPNILIRSVEEAPDQLPEYLYDTNPWNDGAYLLNKDVLVRALYVVKRKRRGTPRPCRMPLSGTGRSSSPRSWRWRDTSGRRPRTRLRRRTPFWRTVRRIWRWSRIG